MNSFKKLVPYFKSHARQYAIGIMAVLFSNIAVLFTPYIIRLAIDDLSKTSGAIGHPMWMYGLALMASILISSGLMLIVRRKIVVASRQTDYEIRRDIFANLTHLDKAFFDKSRTGDIMNRLTSDLSAVREMIGFGFWQIFNTIVVFIASLAIMFSISWKLTLLVLIILPVMVGVLSVLMKLIAKRYMAVQEQSSAISAMAQENFSGIRVVKGYAIEDRELKTYKNMNDELIKRSLGLTKLEGPLWPFVTLLIGISYVLVLVFGGRMILDGHLTLGEFTQFTLTLDRFAWPMMAVGYILQVSQRGLTSWGRLLELLQAQPEITSPTHPASATSIQGDIRLNNVSLTLADRTLLRNIHLHIPEGTVLGITGATGSGKTLLAQLVTRSIDASEGEVQIDGLPIKSLPLGMLREHIGIVPQEPFLFSETVAENIAFGLNTTNFPEIPTKIPVFQTQVPPKPDLQLDMEKVRWAANIAGIDKDIEGFPEGYHTEIGERGVTLSGGQRQRTALARALAKEPRILILDDSMSAVDTETEARILNGLREVLPGRTVLLISHRVSTLRHTDKIIVLDSGSIVEEGTHTDLIARGGHYAAIERKQRLAEEVNA